MSEDELSAIEERAERATPGPWHAHRDADSIGLGPIVFVHIPRADKDRSYALTNGERENSNRDFIAHARTDVPALVAEVRRLRGAMEKVREFADASSPDINYIWVALEMAGMDAP